MQFQSSRAHFSLDSQSAAVLSAWENSQRHIPVHRPQFPYNAFPLSPVSPSSSESTSSSSMSMSSSNPWSSSSLSELEIIQLRRGIISATPAQPLAEREPCLPTANQHHFFDFDFSLPHLQLPLQPPSQLPSQHHQLRCSPPLPTPTTPSSTSTLFNTPPVSPTNHMNFRRESPSSSSMKRSSSDDRSDCSASPTTVTTTKKPRACMSMKDFVPPDVTGLSKREARLVKNRAAAFLSRQRKREEFELMEIRVAELEQENARLRDLADGLSPPPASSPSDSSELELLRMELAAAHQREAELAHRLELSRREQKVKTEMYEPVLSDGTSSGANSPLLAGSPLKNIVANPKGGASLGLMVLLCALPSLLSHPSSHPRSTLPTSQSFLDTIQWDAPSFFPTSASTSATANDVPSWELDYPGTGSGAGTGNMDMDVDYGNVQNVEEGQDWKKLELGVEGGEDMGVAGLGLGALEISFTTCRTKDGKIRVRVHSSPSSPSSTSTSACQSKSEQVSPTSDDVIDPALMAFSLPSLAQSRSPPVSNSDAGVNPLSLSYVDADPLGPFLGAGSSPAGAFELGSPFDFSNANSVSGLTGCQAVLDGTKSGERRRVRIALHSLPQPGGEGGEWEVEVR